MKKYIFILCVASLTATTQLHAQTMLETDASHHTRQGDKIRLRTPSDNDMLKEHTFFSVDEKCYSYQEFEALMKNPDNIQSIHIVKDLKEIQQYTSDKKYQVVIKVILKK